MPETTQSQKLTRYHITAILAALAIGGLLFRLSHMPADVPVKWDGLLYFWYASDVALLDSLPLDHTPANNGWPIFLSFFFQAISSGNYADYILVQRLVGIALSVLTIIPVYMICKRFFSPGLALVGPALFVFEPRIALNSYIGYAEPLFVLLIAISVACLLSGQRNMAYAAFAVLALAAITRGEAVILIVPYAILYIVKFRHSKRTAWEAPLLIILFILILQPISAYKIEVAGTDAMFMRIYDAFDGSESGSGPTPSQIEPDYTRIIPEYAWLALSGMPILMAFVPYGIYRMLNTEMDRITVLVLLGFMGMASAYFLSLFFAPRYTFWTVPMLAIFGVFFVHRISCMFPKRNVALVCMVALLLASFVTLGELKRDDMSERREGLEIGQIIAAKSGDSKYAIEAHSLHHRDLAELEKFPILKGDRESRGANVQFCSPVCTMPDGAVLAGFVESFREDNIAYLITDGSGFLGHVFDDEDTYPYLSKVYDSDNDGFEYRVKMFEIDYEEFGRQ